MIDSTEEPLHRLQAVSHPGPAADQRISAVETRGVSFRRRIPTYRGAALYDVLSETVAMGGSRYGLVEFSAADLSRVDYCVPADGDEVHPMWYSATMSSPNARVLAGTATIGLRDGKRWSHVHALWLEKEGGMLKSGHVWPETTVDDGLLEAEAISFDSVELSYGVCEEAGMPVFEPSSSPAPAAAGSLQHKSGENTEIEVFSRSRFIVARVRPNVLLSEAIQTLCAEFGIAEGRIRGGTGSLIGAVFSAEMSARHRMSSPPPATEVVYLRGRVSNSFPCQQFELYAGLVDKTGTFHAGRLDPTTNRVAVTYDLVIEDLLC